MFINKLQGYLPPPRLVFSFVQHLSKRLTDDHIHVVAGYLSYVTLNVASAYGFSDVICDDGVSYFC